MKETLSKIGKKIPTRVVGATLALGAAVGTYLFPPLPVILAGAAVGYTAIDSVRKSNERKNGEPDSRTQEKEANEQLEFGNKVKTGLKDLVTAQITEVPTPQVTQSKKPAGQNQSNNRKRPRTPSFSAG